MTRRRGRVFSTLADFAMEGDSRMHVLLVNPIVDHPTFQSPNLGLGSLAGMLLSTGHQVTLLDCVRQQIRMDQWKQTLHGLSFDVIGFQTFTNNVHNVATMVRTAAEVRPEAVRVLGGPHATAAPEQILSELGAVDFVIRSEGEHALVRLLEVLNQPVPDFASVPNLAWREGERIVLNEVTLEPNLDRLPGTAWPLIPPKAYSRLPHGVFNKASPVAPLQATRGCPYNCAFCSAGAQMGKPVRMRSVSSVVNEMELLVKEYGAREIHFEDDNLTFYRDYILELCESVLDRGIRVPWACPNGVRLDRLNERVVSAMERAGCYSFAAGIESGSDAMLRRMGKGQTAAQTLEKLWMVRRSSRIQVTGFFVVGFPGETSDTLAETERFILKAPLDRISVSPFMPLPATRAFDELVEQGRLSARPDWSRVANYSDEDYVSYCELSAQELLARARKVNLRFYLRPSILRTTLAKIHSLEQVKALTRAGLYLLGVRKDRFW